MRAVITGTGMYIPEMRVDNDAMSKIMDTSDEWIRVRTGIEQRHYAAPNEATSDLATPAARKAIADAGLEPSDIDYLVVATMTPDYFFPGSAPFIQRKLGLEQIPCLDIRQQCAGFVYALQIADALIRSSQCKRVVPRPTRRWFPGATRPGRWQPASIQDRYLMRSSTRTP